ncbi:MFS transporter [Solihabitans fulvus]|uniref:MFS transporter n=1 Tax=Solihabitans fulvus TaxID=1892852 RepID=A0A5B2XND9_9PSEU|nr:MFS transporter [Solihabitans fulvus]KAA2265247.1 MFS transporter [Solihabitans fulvus]
MSERLEAEQAGSGDGEQAQAGRPPSGQSRPVPAEDGRAEITGAADRQPGNDPGLPAAGETVEQGVRTPAFRRLMGAWTVSLVGDGVRIVALPLYTAISTRSPLAASAVAVAAVLPWLLIALPAGVLVDRWRPRRVVATAHAFRAVVTAVLAVAAFTGHAGVALLAAVAFVLASAETFADSAAQLLLVELAGPDDLERANGRFVMVETVGMDLAGPLAASALFLWQPAACFALDALSFVLAAVFVARLPDVVPERAPSAGSMLAGLRAQLAEGGGYLLRSRGLRVLVAAVMLTAISAAAGNAVLALFAIQTLGVPPAVVPGLVVAMSIGAIAGSRTTPALAPRFGAGQTMVGALATLGVSFVLLGAVHHVAVAAVACFLAGFGSAGWNVLSATRRQRLTPSAMMGRVTSAYRVLAWGLMPLGAGLAGPLAQLTSLGTVFLAAGSVIVLTAFVFARPLVRS